MSDNRVPGQYIVVLEDSIARPGDVAQAQVEQRGGEIGFVYRSALKGYSAELSKGAVEALRRDPRVQYVVPDREVEALAQTVPMGVSRIAATGNPALDIDGQDDLRINADVAVIDTGIDYTHPDLNVFARTNCVPPSGEGAFTGCIDSSGTDARGHGTHVAGTIGAIDNGQGVVGVAPGARLWAVKVLRDSDGSGFTSWIIGGIDWVTARASQIEVANMSLGGSGSVPAQDEAINASLNAGVVYAVAAGNSSENAKSQYPANNPNVITVSALADYDGQAGAKSGTSCIDRGADDTTATFSNWGSLVDIAAPGVCVYSSLPEGKYGYSWGTSMATPHVAGAAAVLASQDNPNSKGDVDEIRDSLVNGASLDWADKAEDANAEPLLYLGANPLSKTEVASAGVTIADGKTATLHGALNGRGLATEYHFEFGSTTAYGGKAPASPKTIGAGAGYATVSETIAGLEPEQTYHYRLVVKSSSGTFYGDDRTFTSPRWGIEAPVSQPGANGHEWLNDISCPNVGSCMAVGHYYKSTNLVLAYELKGGQWNWRSVSAPAGGTFPELNDVSCSSSSACTAVGQVQISGTYRPMAVRWNGSNWSTQSISSPAGATTSNLNSVSCPSANHCLAVGYVKNSAGVWVNYSAQWNGSTWSNITTPTAEDWAEGELRGVSCHAAGSCTAVGWYTTTAGQSKPTIMKWSGSSWSSQAPARSSGSLAGVDCTSAQFCVAVGGFPTAETWDGSKWVLQETADLGGDTAAYLYDVSCLSPSQCTAVGSVKRGPRTAPLVQRWNGGAWRARAVPRIAEEGSIVRGVACTTQEGCSAVGRFSTDRLYSMILTHKHAAIDAANDMVAISSDGTANVFSVDDEGINIANPIKSLKGQVDPAFVDGKGHYVIDVADVNNDGSFELITVKDDGKVLVHPGQEDRTFGTALDAGISLPPVMNWAGSNEPIAVADVTGDGFDDLVVHQANPTRISLFKGQADGKFTTTPVQSLSASISSALISGTGNYFLDVVDVDGDKRADLVAMSSSNVANVYKGGADGKFATATTAASVNSVLNDGVGQEPVGLGDVSGDGRADLLTLDGTTLKLWTGKSDGKFATAATAYEDPIDSSLLDGSGEELLGLLDYNADGRADLASLKDGNLFLYESSSDGTLEAPVSSGAEITSLRSSRSGLEFLLERPFQGRFGCVSRGCLWPPAVAESDVNNDGRSDLVTIDSEGTAHVFNGSPNGIEAGSPIDSLSGILDPALGDGGGHYVIDTSDVNGDGLADLVTLRSSGGIRVYPGQKNGGFGGAIVSLGGLKPVMHGVGDFEPVGVADVTKDGLADLVGFSSSTASISAYPSQGNGAFGSVATSLSGQVNSALFDGTGDYFLDVADADGDRDGDLVAVDNAGKLRVYRSNGAGSFTVPTISVASVDPVTDDGEGHEALGLGDVTGDRRADLITLHHGSEKAFVLAGQPDGKFAYPPSGPEGLAAAYTGIDSNLTDTSGEELVGLLDYSRDGLADLISVDENGDVLAYRAQPDGTFAAPISQEGDLASIRHATEGHEMAFEKSFLRRVGCQPTGCKWNPEQSGYSGIADSDVDDDGRSDLVTVDSYGTVHVFGSKNGGIDPAAAKSSLVEQIDPALTDGSGQHVVDTADVTGDGRADLVTIKSSGGAYVYPGAADRTFGTGIQAGPDVPGDGAFEPVAVTDVNGDGNGDLVGGFFGFLQIHLGQASGSFGSATWSAAASSALTSGSGHYFVDAADVTGDGRADLVSMHTNGSAYLFAGQANGALTSPVVAASIDPVMDDGTGHEPVGLGDVDRDGKADLLTLDGSGSLKLYRGQWDGTFASPSSPFAGTIDSSLEDGSGLELVGLLDYNRDGRADLVALDEDGDALAFEAQANGTLAAPVTQAGSIDPIRLSSPGHEAAAEKPLLRRAGCRSSGCERSPRAANSDIDGDGRADLTAIDSGGTARVFRGRDTGIDVGASVGSLEEEVDPALFDGEGHYPIDTADVTGEGHADLVTVDSSGGINLYPGGPDRSFGPAVRSDEFFGPPAMTGSGSFEPIAVARGNWDGKADFLGLYDVFGLTFLVASTATASGEFKEWAYSTSNSSALLGGAGEYYLGAADIDGAGRADVVGMHTNGTVYTHLANGVEGTISFTTPREAASINPVMDDGTGHEPVGLGDVDRDGKADLLTLDGSGSLKLYRGQWDGTFASPSSPFAGTIDSSLEDGSGLELVGLLDYNRDGRADLVALDEDGDALAFEALPGATFATPVILEGSIDTVRQSGAAGGELLAEKPLLRRAACTSTGCDLP